MPDLKYIHCAEDSSLARGIGDVHRGEVLTDCFFIAEGGERIKCHQCILAISPILKPILTSLEFRLGGGGLEVGLSIPDFHPESIRKLLHFLYVGEVYLQKGSRTLLEFKELCDLLEINPSVNKFRRSTRGEEKVSTQEKLKTEPIDDEDIPRIPCEFCSLSLPDRSTYEAHVGDCEIRHTPLDDVSFKMPDNFDLPDEIIRGSSSSCYAQEENEKPRPSSSESSDSDGFEELLVATSASPSGAVGSVKPSKESQGNLLLEKKKKFPSKLIDDLFGEDNSNNASGTSSIMHQSCNINSNKKNGSEKPLGGQPLDGSVSRTESFEKKSPSSQMMINKKKSVIDELNEKRQRTISKLKDTSGAPALLHIQQPPPPRSKTKSVSSWFEEDSSSESDAIDEDIATERLSHRCSTSNHKQKPPSKKSLKVVRSARLSSSSSSSEEESLIEENNDDSLLSNAKGRLVRVSVQLNGRETFMEYATYKLRLLCGSEEDSMEETDSDSASRLRRVRKKHASSSYEETKWDKLKLKRLERSKSVSEIKSIIESKTAAKTQISGHLERSFSEALSSSKKPRYDNKPSSYPFNFNYGLSSENKLLESKSPSEALLALSKVSFKKKNSSSSSSSSSGGGGLLSDGTAKSTNDPKSLSPSSSH